MNRQTRTFIVVAIAVVAATVASYGTYRALSRIPPRPVEMPTKKAVVAAKQMPLGRSSPAMPSSLSTGRRKRRCRVASRRLTKSSIAG
jgi:hypothetical protein